MGGAELMHENLLGKLIVGAGSPFLGIVVSLSVINEYLQLIPFFNRTFDYNDMLFSAFGLVIACYHFMALQRRAYFV